MDIVTPGIGLIFWTTLLFAAVVGILGKFAFKPIAEALRAREHAIDTALKASQDAKGEVNKLKEQIEGMKQQARSEREEIIKDARSQANKILSEAQEKAKEEYNRSVTAAQEAIRGEQKAAMTQIKTLVAELSLDIAEKVVRKQLSSDSAQKELVNKLIDDVKLN